MPTISIFLNDTVVTELKANAKKLGTSFQDLIRMRINHGSIERSINDLDRKVDAALDLIELSANATGFTLGASRASVENHGSLLEAAVTSERDTRKQIKKIKQLYKIDE